MPKYKVSRNFVTGDTSYDEGQEIELAVAEADRIIAKSKANFPERPDLLVKIYEKESKKADK